MNRRPRIIWKAAETSSETVKTKKLSLASALSVMCLRQVGSALHKYNQAPQERDRHEAEKSSLAAMQMGEETSNGGVIQCRQASTKTRHH
jgi:hypothetical protein